MKRQCPDILIHDIGLLHPYSKEISLKKQKALLRELHNLFLKIK